MQIELYSFYISRELAVKIHWSLTLIKSSQQRLILIFEEYEGLFSKKNQDFSQFLSIINRLHGPFNITVLLTAFDGLPLVVVMLPFSKPNQDLGKAVILNGPVLIDY
jgi:hypothetical protein